MKRPLLTSLNTLRLGPLGLWLLLALTSQGLLASAYDDFLERTGTQQQGADANELHPGGTKGPEGWPGYAPNNAPPPEKPATPPEVPPVESSPTTTVLTGLSLSSADIANGALVIDQTCLGKDLSPTLSWTLQTSSIPTDQLTENDIPVTNIKSYAVTLLDDQGRTLWIAYNISPNATSIPSGLPNTSFATGLYQGRNDLGTLGYSGPCPKDTAQHGYTFTFYALKTSLSFSDIDKVTAKDFGTAILGNILSFTTLTASFSTATPPPAPTFKLTSTAFTEGSAIPQSYTCDGDNQSPPLAWADIPTGTASLVLTLLDTDASSDQVHWIAYNIPTTKTALAAGAAKLPFVDGFYQGKNDSAGTGYTGPCPPAGENHHYRFSLLALDTGLTPPGNPGDLTYDQLLQLTQGHVLGTATLTGTYTLSGARPEFTLRSSEFVDQGAMGPDLTCEGSDRSPALSWTNLPTGTAALALSVVDIDSPDSYVHWVAYNIPTSQTGLDPNIAKIPLTGGFYQGKNSAGGVGYKGPCPPPGETHRYRFTLMALDQSITPPAAPGDLTYADLLQFTQGHVLGTAELTGQYSVGGTPPEFTLTSSAIGADGKFAANYTCDNTNQSPPVSWANLPTGTQALALTFIDSDSTGPYSQWVVYNIPPSKLGLDAAVPKIPFVDGFYQGQNSAGTTGYTGPCPPPGENHHYRFSLLALDAPLATTKPPGESTYADILALAQGHIIDVAEATGTYERSLTSALGLTSSAFENMRAIPRIYTCDGLAISPPLAWANAPADTQSFALLMTDFNGPTGSRNLWAIFDIPKEAASLSQNIPKGAITSWIEGGIPRTANQARNDFDILGYGAPCPGIGDGQHRFAFEMRALDVANLGVAAGDPMDKVLAAVQGHTLASATLNGLYERDSGAIGAFGLTSTAFEDNGILPVQFRSVYTPVEYAAGHCTEWDTPVPHCQRNTFGTLMFYIERVMDCSGPDTGENGVKRWGCVPGARYRTRICSNEQNDQPVTGCVIPVRDSQNKVTNQSEAYYAELESVSTAELRCDQNDWADGAGVLDTEIKNISPALQWDNVPAGTKSLVLFFNDEQNNVINSGEGRTHWVVWNIPPTLNGLNEDVAKLPFTGSVYQGRNAAPWGVTEDIQGLAPGITTEESGINYISLDDAQKMIDNTQIQAHYNGYWGACRPGRYIFTLVALDTTLSFSPVSEVTYDDVINAMVNHILGTAEVLNTRVP